MSKRRHGIVQRFLEALGVDPVTARSDAEGIETMSARRRSPPSSGHRRARRTGRDGGMSWKSLGLFAGFEIVLCLTPGPAVLLILSQCERHVKNGRTDRGDVTGACPTP